MTIKTDIWTKIVSESKSCEMYLKICTLVNLKALGTNLKVIL